MPSIVSVRFCLVIVAAATALVMSLPVLAGEKTQGDVAGLWVFYRAETKEQIEQFKARLYGSTKEFFRELKVQEVCAEVGETYNKETIYRRVLTETDKKTGTKKERYQVGFLCPLDQSRTPKVVYTFGDALTYLATQKGDKDGVVSAYAAGVCYPQDCDRDGTPEMRRKGCGSC